MQEKPKTEGYSAPAPPVEDQYSAPKAPESQYGAPAPAPVESYGAPEESYGAPEESYGAPEVSYGAPEDSYGAPEEEDDDEPLPTYGAYELVHSGYFFLKILWWCLWAESRIFLKALKLVHSFKKTINWSLIYILKPWGCTYTKLVT